MKWLKPVALTVSIVLFGTAAYGFSRRVSRSYVEIGAWKVDGSGNLSVVPANEVVGYPCLGLCSVSMEGNVMSVTPSIFGIVTAWKGTRETYPKESTIYDLDGGIHLIYVTDLRP